MLIGVICSLPYLGKISCFSRSHVAKCADFLSFPSELLPSWYLVLACKALDPNYSLLARTRCGYGASIDTKLESRNLTWLPKFFSDMQPSNYQKTLNSGIWQLYRKSQKCCREKDCIKTFTVPWWCVRRDPEMIL